MPFLDNFLLLFFILVFAASCWGLGSFLARDQLASVTILFGMTVILFAIGVLNLIGIAYLPVLALPFVFGLYRAVTAGARTAKAASLPGLLSRDNLVIAVMLLLIWFLCAVTVAFPEGYNVHDDYQKYFIQPVKMLATGSFYGSPLSAVGKETLGGQAAMQALFIGFNGLPAINAFDAVFCLLLACFLVLEVGRERGSLFLGVLATLLLVVIHTQYVNISSIYSFVCFAVGVVILHERMLQGERKALSLCFAFGFGAFYASTIALKPLNIFFALFHFPLVIVSLVLTGYGVKSVLKWSCIATIAGLLFVLPWSIRTIWLSARATGGDGMTIPILPDWGNLSHLFAAEAFFGGAPVAYVLLLVGGVVLYISNATNSRWKNSAPRLSAGTAILCAGLLIVYVNAFIGNELHPFETTLRYSTPFLISLVPISLLLLAQVEEGGSGARRKIHRVLSISVFLCFIALWLPTKLEFIKQSRRVGSALSFWPTEFSRLYRDYNHYVLKGDAQQRLRGFQQLIPEGATILAWVNYAHLFDFKRNKIIEVDPAGLGNSWATVPDADYLIIDIAGSATRSRSDLEEMVLTEPLYDAQIWQASLALIDYLESRVKVESVLSAEWEIQVFKISLPENRNFKSADLPPRPSSDKKMQGNAVP